jgi:hypothetical protein
MLIRSQLLEKELGLLKFIPKRHDPYWSLYADTLTVGGCGGRGGGFGLSGNVTFQLNTGKSDCFSQSKVIAHSCLSVRCALVSTSTTTFY